MPESVPTVSMSQKLSFEFTHIQKQIEEAYISVGLITDHMYDYLMRTLAGANIISIVTGIHMPTSPTVLEKLKVKCDQGGIEAGVFTKNYFHPKIYIFKLRNSWISFAGSGNLTKGGWFENEELFVTVADQETCKQLVNRHRHWLENSQPITDRLITLYKEAYSTNIIKEKEKRKTVQDLVDNLADVFNIDNVNFTGQYFSKPDHLAFEPGKTHLDTPAVLDERNAVRNKLYKLDTAIMPLFPKQWDIHHHYMYEHIVANIETRHHHESNVRGLWIAYGRSQRALKRYGEVDTTPLNFIRMQLIVQYKSVGLWLMAGKSGGSRIDREYFQAKIQDRIQLQNFYLLLRSLGENYWIEVAMETRGVTTFETPESLKEFLNKDNWRYYYFNIGINYPLGSPDLLAANITNTVLSNFAKFYPLYEFIKDDF